MKKKLFLLPYLISICLVFVGLGVIYNVYGINIPKINVSSNASSYTKSLEDKITTEAKKLSTKTGVVVTPATPTTPPATPPTTPPNNNKVVTNTFMCFFEDSGTYTCSSSLGTSCTGAGRCQLTVSAKIGTLVTLTINDADKTSITRKIDVSASGSGLRDDLIFRSKSGQKSLENKCLADNTYTDNDECYNDLDCCPGSMCRCPLRAPGDENDIGSKKTVTHIYSAPGCVQGFKKICLEVGTQIISDFDDPTAIPAERPISEKVTCDFGYAKTKQFCRSSKGDYCEGIGSCTLIVSGMMSDINTYTTDSYGNIATKALLRWTTGCRKQKYPFMTATDGENNVIKFGCPDESWATSTELDKKCMFDDSITYNLACKKNSDCCPTSICSEFGRCTTTDPIYAKYPR